MEEERVKVDEFKMPIGTRHEARSEGIVSEERKLWKRTVSAYLRRKVQTDNGVILFYFD